MTTTNTYNPLLNAFRELTTPQAFRWYGTQAKATATLASTIAFRSYTTAQRLLSDRKSVAFAPAIAEPEYAQTLAPAVQDDSEAEVGLENAIALEQESTTASTSELELDDSESDADAPSVRLAIDEPEQAIAQQEYAQAEATEPEPDFREAIADDGEAEAGLAWVDAALLDDEDPTERRYWAGEDEDDAGKLAGDD